MQDPDFVALYVTTNMLDFAGRYLTVRYCYSGSCRNIGSPTISSIFTTSSVRFYNPLLRPAFEASPRAALAQKRVDLVIVLQ